VPGIFDFFLFIVFVIVQWCIAAELWKRISSRWRALPSCSSKRWLLSATPAAFAGPGRLTMSRRPRGVAGAAAITYLVVSSFTWAIYWTVGRIRKHFAAPTSAPAGKALNAAGNLAMAAPLLTIGYGALIERTRFRVREVERSFPASRQSSMGSASCN